MPGKSISDIGSELQDPNDYRNQKQRFTRLEASPSTQGPRIESGRRDQDDVSINYDTKSFKKSERQETFLTPSRSTRQNPQSRISGIPFAREINLNEKVFDSEAKSQHHSRINGVANKAGLDKLRNIS